MRPDGAVAQPQEFPWNVLGFAKGFSLMKPSRVLPDSDRPNRASAYHSRVKYEGCQLRSWSELPEHLLEAIIMSVVPELRSWEDLKDPRPDTSFVRCYVRRQEWPHSKGGVVHKYFLQLGQDWAHDAGKFVLSAYQDGRQRFHIGLNKVEADAEVAILTSNLLHTSYQLTVPRSDWAKGLATTSGCTVQGRSLGRVNYKMRVHGIRLPRRMTVVLPRPTPEKPRIKPSQTAPVPELSTSDAVQLSSSAPSTSAAAPAAAGSAAAPGAAAAPAGGAPAGQAAAHDDQSGWRRIGLLQRVVSYRVKSFRTAQTPPAAPQPTGNMRLQNKPPHWNEQLRCWCLNFRGRVKLASVKNFQLMVAEDTSARMIMQFGKVDKDVFILDVNPTILSIVQAFAVALTTFETKILP